MIKRLATPIAVAVTAILLTASPASAVTSSGEQNNFQFSCDATVFISDSLIGSPGRIEAWGGFSCPSPQQWGGVLQIEIYRNGVKVASNGKNSDFASTNSVEVSTANTSGSQSWKAYLKLNGPGQNGALVWTGTINS